MSSRRFILSLPGPVSYCSCDSLCSQLTLEHVLPKSFIKTRTCQNQFKLANRDPHNLFSCCQLLNSEKSNHILGVSYDAEEHSGRLARACLHMNEHYRLATNPDWVQIWKNFSLLYPPDSAEYLRNELITEKTGIKNRFIDPV